MSPSVPSGTLDDFFSLKIFRSFLMVWALKLKMLQKSALVFIDAGYLSKISKYFGSGKHIKLDLILFSKRLAEKQELVCEHVFYYTAPPFQGVFPTPLEMRLKAGYDSFMNNVKKSSMITVREGRLQKIGSSFTQKGVDTLLTMDLCQEPFDRKINCIILLAADTDFVPVLNQLRFKNKVKVFLYYFTDRIRGSLFSMSNHLLTACNKSILLTKEDFISNTLDNKNEKKG